MTCPDEKVQWAVTFFMKIVADGDRLDIYNSKRSIAYGKRHFKPEGRATV
jgi:hypothetical protein